jgi:hypothetical protein
MFILGLVVGPIAGLLAGDYLFRSHVVHPAVAASIIGAGYVFLVVAQFIDQELRIGLAAGLMLGILLAAGPMDLTAREPS